MVQVDSGLKPRVEGEGDAGVARGSRSGGPVGGIDLSGSAVEGRPRRGDVFEATLARSTRSSRRVDGVVRRRVVGRSARPKGETPARSAVWLSISTKFDPRRIESEREFCRCNYQPRMSPRARVRARQVLFLASRWAESRAFTRWAENVPPRAGAREASPFLGVTTRRIAGHRKSSM